MQPVRDIIRADLVCLHTRHGVFHRRRSEVINYGKFKISYSSHKLVKFLMKVTLLCRENVKKADVVANGTATANMADLGSLHLFLKISLVTTVVNPVTPASKKEPCFRANLG